jgi:D-3-phosphoglycerate dehydrogenase / 2-oxoglutarate reductase
VAGTVLLTDRPFGSDDIEQAVLAEAGLELRRAPDTDPETLASMAEEADGLLVCYAKVGQPIIEAAQRGGCKVIGRYGIGYDNIDIASATRAGIVVTYVPDYCLDEVADHTLALLLCAARAVLPAALGVRDGRWQVPDAGVHRMRGRRLALVGVGRIGRKVAERAQAFGLEVVAYDPYVGEAPDGMVMAATIEEALSDADFVSLHAPLTEQTRHVIDDDTIAMMARRPVLVNTSRGGLVDLEAATRALEDGRLGGVAFDVTEVEPLPDQHQLRTHPRAIVTPHISFYSAEAQEELQRRTVGEVVSVLTGRAPQNPVNPEVLAPTAAGA